MEVLKQLFPHYDENFIRYMFENNNFEVESTANSILNEIMQNFDYEVASTITNKTEQETILAQFEEKTKPRSSRFHFFRKKTKMKPTFQHYTEPLIVPSSDGYTRI